METILWAKKVYEPLVFFFYQETIFMDYTPAMTKGLKTTI